MHRALCLLTLNRKMLNSHLSLFSCLCFACFYLCRTNGTPSASYEHEEQQHRLGFTNRTKLNILLCVFATIWLLRCDARARSHNSVQTHIAANIECENVLLVFVSFED